MPETGHATTEALINEAQVLLERLLLVKHKLRDSELEFVESLDGKIRKYGYGAFVSAKQLFWLRDLESRYANDPRQMKLLEQAAAQPMKQAPHSTEQLSTKPHDPSIGF